MEGVNSDNRLYHYIRDEAVEYNALHSDCMDSYLADLNLHKDALIPRVEKQLRQDYLTVALPAAFFQKSRLEGYRAVWQELGSQH